MRASPCFSLSIWCLGAGLLLAGAASAEVIVLSGGTVLDGSGGSGRVADVRVEGGRIHAIGESLDRPSDRVVDVSGLVVAPGFIDTHAHGDPLKTPAFENFLRMGVTTLCLGQDGFSPFAEDLEEWRQDVEKAGVGPNIAPFVGHSTVRDRAGVGIDPEPARADLDRMAGIVEAALEAGAFGLTTGLEYQPGSFARLEELVIVARPVGAVKGVVQSHMRSEDNGDISRAIDELLTQGKQSGSRVHVSHIKVVYGRGAKVAEEVLQQLDSAKDRGVSVTADLYPYTASHTTIGIVFPDWAKPPHDYEEVVRTKREDLAAYLRTRILQRNGPEATLFGSGEWSGKTLAQAAEEAGKPFEEVLIEIGPSGASGAYFVMDQATMERFLIDPRVMICTDGSPEMLHPRGYGSFARILARHVREQQLLTLEEAIHKMSGLPAATIGLDQQSSEEPGSLRRGRLEPGWAADIVVFDPATVQDRATFENPHPFAAGFRHVLVNGRFVIEDERLTDELPGRVLRRASL